VNYLDPQENRVASEMLTKWTATSAAEVCKQFPLGDEAQKLPREDLAPGQFLDALIAEELWLDALRFLAHALPRREAVWWACACVRSVAGANLPAPGAAALQAAQKWVADPSEENRRAAQAAAAAAGLGTPAGCAAIAAFWSGGSLGPANVPAVPPADNLTGQGVAGAVLLAAVQTEPQKAAEKHRQFVQLGLEVATGANQWK
jgi:hypothetical protein